MAENFDPDGLEAEEAFIASSFVQFHTEKPSSGEWIPMTDAEAGERWTSWLAAHDAQVAADAWDIGFHAGVNHELGDWEIAPDPIVNPYRVAEGKV